MKEKFRELSEKLDSYIKTKRFRWYRGLILTLGFAVTGCVCFLAGFFLNRSDNMIYKSNISATAEKQTGIVTSAAETSGPETTETIKETEPVTSTEAPKMTIDEDMLHSYIYDDITLSDAVYDYTDTTKFENRNSLKDVPLPLTKKSFTIQYNGTVTAGIDSSLIEVVTDNDNYVITVILPEASITSHDIHADSFSITNIKDNLINPITDDDYMNACLSRQDIMEQNAIKSGLIDETYKSAKETIFEYLNLDGIISSLYTIEFVTPDSQSEI